MSILLMCWQNEGKHVGCVRNKWLLLTSDFYYSCTYCLTFSTIISVILSTLWVRIQTASKCCRFWISKTWFSFQSESVLTLFTWFGLKIPHGFCNSWSIWILNYTLQPFFHLQFLNYHFLSLSQVPISHLLYRQISSANIWHFNIPLLSYLYSLEQEFFLSQFYTWQRKIAVPSLELPLHQKMVCLNVYFSF